MTNSTQVASNIRALGAFLCVALFVSAASATVCEYEAWSVEQDFPIPPVFGGKSTPSGDNPCKGALLNAIKGIRPASSRSDLDISETPVSENVGKWTSPASVARLHAAIDFKNVVTTLLK